MGNLETFDIKSHVIESIVEVFDTMMSMEIVPSDCEPEDTRGVDRLVTGVNFAGHVSGFLNIQVTYELARLMTTNILDMELDQLDGDRELRDLLSEISNIVGGNLISALQDAGLPCVLSAPDATSGGDFTIRSANLERFERLVFMHHQQRIIVEVGIKSQQGEEIHYSVNGDGEPEQEPSPTGPAAQQYPSPPAEQEAKTSEDVDLDLLLDIPLEIKVELGRTRIEIQELLNLVPGSAVKLTKLEGEPVDILANDTLIAKGEVMVQREKYGIRVTEITSRLDRIRSFGL